MAAMEQERRAEFVRRIRRSRSFRHLRGMAFFAASIGDDLATVASRIGARCAVCEAIVAGGSKPHGDEFLCLRCEERFKKSSHVDFDFWLMSLIVKKPKWLRQNPPKLCHRRRHMAHRERQPSFMRRRGRNKGSPPTWGFNSYCNWKAWKARHDWRENYYHGGRRSRHLIGIKPRPKWEFYKPMDGWELSEWLYAQIAEANGLLRPANARIVGVSRRVYRATLEVVVDWDIPRHTERVRGRFEKDLRKIIGCDCHVEVYKAWGGLNNTNSLDVYFKEMRHQEAADRRFWAPVMSLRN